MVIHNKNYMNKAIRILKKAEDACLISRSITSNVTMEINIEVNPLLIDIQ